MVYPLILALQELILKISTYSFTSHGAKAVAVVDSFLARERNSSSILRLSLLIPSSLSISSERIASKYCSVSSLADSIDTS